MSKGYLITAGLTGFTAVAIGAFGAHGLKEILTQKMMAIYNTGVLYHLVHSAILLALALSKKSYKFFPLYIRWNSAFSFSLYFYALSGIQYFVYITPVGGICFLAGWGFIIYYALRNRE